LLLCLAAVESIGGAMTAETTSEAPKSAAATPVHTSNIDDPLNPLPAVSINECLPRRAAITLVADPLDTRLGRSFDIQISALIRSFQFDGYVLQGHSLPWQVGGVRGDRTTSDMHRRTPGVLVFRKDNWRSQEEPPSVSYFVMFLVGESPVFGVQREAFLRAATQVRVLSAGVGTPQHSDDQTPTETTCVAPDLANDEAGRVQVLGPMFSGSLVSLADIAQRADLRLDLRSPSATVDSNDRITRFAQDERLKYQTYAAWSQADQLNILFKYLLQQHHICPGEVVILAEESSFGQGAFDIRLPRDTDPDETCTDRMAPRPMQFPQNIAAIRAEHAQLDAGKKSDVDLSLIPKRNLELDMKDVADSPDLPPVYQPTLTSRSDELSLQHQMDTLAMQVRPKAVLIVATDVRDRLFMLSAVRRAVPAALPAVLEGDHLLAHPDYRRANRGTLMVRNGQMNLCYEYVDEARWRQCGNKPRASGENSGRSNDGRNSCEITGRKIRRRFAFPTDYAAGLFLASRSLLQNEPNPVSSDGTPLDVITLAGTQAIDPNPADETGVAAATPAVLTEAGEEKQPRLWTTRGTLIAADLRDLAFQALLPLGLVVSAMLLLSSVWLRSSSRPGRTILPLLRHAARETRWWLGRRVRRNRAGSGYSRDRNRKTRRVDRSTSPWAAVLIALSLLLCVAMAWQWIQMLAVRIPKSTQGIAGLVCNLRENLPGNEQKNIMNLVHGRDIPMLFILMGAYLWFVVLIATRIHAWNQRCHLHWRHGLAHPGRNPHAQRNYHVTSMCLALMMSLPPFVTWWARYPMTIDYTGLTALFAFLIMLACLYFLAQALLQAYRLFELARDVRDLVINDQPHDVVPPNWPTPQLLGEPAQSPIAVAFRDRDWHALEKRGSKWPLAPRTRQLTPLTTGHDPKEASDWRKRTVAEIKFGLVCVRSCLWGAFVGPLVVLAMIQVYPFAFEWEHSAIALCVLGLAFAITTWITYKAEQAPLIGQMFTQDGAHVSFIDLLKALGTKLIVVLLVLAATLSPNLGESLQNLLGMVKI
jgi:hypothetical protein